MTPLSLYATQILVDERIAKLHDLAETEHQLRALRHSKARPRFTWRIGRRQQASTS